MTGETVETVEVVVIGAGQAGLAVGWYLQRAGLIPGSDFVIIDGQTKPGGAWQCMWPQLRLFSGSSYSSLPGMPMPPWTHEGTPHPEHVVEYLAEYEVRYELAVRRPVRALTIEPTERGVRVHTSAGDFITRHVINATGTWSRPFVPTWPGVASFAGQQFHTVQYPGAQSLVGSRVAVIGAGNSAAQILAELVDQAETRWITRSRPRFMPADVDSESLFELASARRRQLLDDGPTIADLGDIVQTPTVAHAREVGALVPHKPFDRFEGSDLVWDSKNVRWTADAVIWATGFRPALHHLRGQRLVRSDGQVEVVDGTSVVNPRLHFVGYGDWTGSASATLLGVGQHARRIVDRVLAR